MPLGGMQRMSASWGVGSPRTVADGNARAGNSGINRQKIPTRTEYVGLPSGADWMPCSTDSR